MTAVNVFENLDLGCKIRTIVEESNVLFCASDVAKALGYADHRSAVQDFCKGVVKRLSPTSGGMQEMSYIMEPDLYRLIFGSKLEGAQKFQAWVFEEVLPSIRATGTYAVAPRMTIRESCDMLGISDIGRMICLYHETPEAIPVGMVKEVKRTMDEMSEVNKRAALNIVNNRKIELITELEDAINEKVTSLMNASSICASVNTKAKADDVFSIACHYGYLVAIKSNTTRELYYPTVKGLEYCTPTRVSSGPNKGIEIASVFQWRGQFKKDVESYLLGKI